MEKSPSKNPNGIIDRHWGSMRLGCVKSQILCVFLLFGMILKRHVQRSPASVFTKLLHGMRHTDEKSFFGCDSERRKRPNQKLILDILNVGICQFWTTPTWTHLFRSWKTSGLQTQETWGGLVVRYPGSTRSGWSFSWSLRDSNSLQNGSL